MKVLDRLKMAFGMKSRPRAIEFDIPDDPEARLARVREQIDHCEWGVAVGPMHYARYCAEAYYKLRAEEKWLVELIASQPGNQLVDTTEGW